MLSLVGVLRIAVWDYHLSKTKSIEYWSNVSFIIISDVVQYDSLSIIETNMEVPVLPINGPTVDFERDTLWLRDVQWFDIRTITPLFFDSVRVIVIRRRLAYWSTNFRDINMYYFLLIRIEYRAEVKWERILAVINM